MTTITWKPGVNGGSWTDAADWIGGVVPAAGDSVVIDGGTGFTVIGPVIAAGTSIAVAGIVLTGSDGTLDVKGTLDAGSVDISGDGLLNVQGSASVGTLVMEAGIGGDGFFLTGTLDITTAATLGGGTIAMDGGTLSGTVDMAGGGIGGPGVLQAVTLSGTVAAFGSFAVLGGLSLASATVNLGGDSLDFVGTQTFSGQVIAGLPTLASDGTLNIAAGTTLDDAGGNLTLSDDTSGTATFVNDGLITALVVSLDTDIVNNGTIVLSGTLQGSNVQFDDIGQFDNAGTLQLTGGDTLSPLFRPGSAFSNSGLIEVGASSTLEPAFAGNVTTVPTIDNRGGTIALAAGGVLSGDVPFLGGAIASSGGTVETGLDSLTVAGSIVLLGRSGGADLTFASAAGDASDVITLAPHDPGDPGALTDAATLTFAAGTTLELDETSAIDTTLDMSFPISAASLDLNGMIAALPDGGVTLDATGTLSNSGTIETGAGETLLLEAAAVRDTGTIDLVAGSTLALDAPVTYATLADLAGDATSILLMSTLDLAGTTVTLSPGSLFSRVTFGPGAALHGAVLADGTLVAAGFTPVLGGATLSDLTWVGGLDLSASPTVAVENGLTVTGAGGGPGLLSLGGTVNELNLLTATTLDGMTIGLGGTDSGDLSVLSAEADLSLGASTVVNAAGNDPNSQIFAYGSLSNAGTIEFSGGGSGDLNGIFAVGPVDNAGTIEVGGEPSGAANPLMTSALGATADVSLVEHIIDMALGWIDGLDPEELETLELSGFGISDIVNDILQKLLGLGTDPESSPNAVQGSHIETASALAAATAASTPDFQGTITGSGTILLGFGGGTFLNDTIASTQTIAFGGADAVLGLGAPANVAAQIVGFGQNDGIDLPFSAYAGGSPAYAGGVLSIPVSGGTVKLNVALAAGVTANQLKLTNDSLGGTFVHVACFAQGTRVATPDGEVAVERLRPGDRVCTASGAIRPITWVGHRRLAPRRHSRPHDVQPVRIRQGAFAPGVPHRDLRLSPDHAVFVDGALIPIRYLVNGATVVQEDVASVTYWHVELARHDVLLAEGMACESYLDTGNRDAFVEGGAASRPRANGNSSAAALARASAPANSSALP